MGKITYFVKKKIGKEVHSFSVEGTNLFDVVMTSKNLSFGDVDKCGKCGHDDLMLSAHVGKNKAGKPAFNYTLIKCKKCKSYLNFGQQQENPEVYYLRTTEEKNPDGSIKKNADGSVRKVLDWQDSTVPLQTEE